MLINLLFENPLYFVVFAAVIIIALTVHEFAHAMTAFVLGDTTAKDQGRLTLNPMAHLSLLGSVFLLVVGFGWGKPVPFNPYNLKYKRFGSAIVALAGPASNLILAILFTIGLKVISTYNLLLPENLLVVFLYYSIILNVNLMLFNLLPLAPLDGSKVLFAIITDYKYAKIRQFLETQGPLVLIGLIFIDNFIGINIFGSVFSAVQNFINNIVF